jgi:cobalt-zinc-cadmium efflux system outer membrane protein
MRTRASKASMAALVAVAAALILLPQPGHSATPVGQRLDAAQLVQVALEVNPQVRAARARWASAEHSIKQNYVPNDPVFTYANIDSPTNGFDHAAAHSLIVSDSFQFPGKALLQADNARRAASIARLQYEATVRDIRAAVEARYYQVLLDSALLAVNAENIGNLEQVLKVTQVAYAANQVTQTDFISAEFDLAAARQQQQQLRVNEDNDRTMLNQLLNRPPGEPLALDETLSFKRLSIPLDTLVSRAAAVRQEILQAALAERSRATALKLARLEYAPDYNVSYTFDNYLIPSAGPTLNALQDHGWAFGFNLPVFFWVKQKEDVRRAESDLEAARDDLGSIRSQTAAAVTTLYRSAQLAYDTAVLYRDTLAPLAGQDFRVALVAYSSGKIGFVALAGALRRGYDARVNYLQAANQFVANRVALEQAVGQPLGE